MRRWIFGLSLGLAGVLALLGRSEPPPAPPPAHDEVLLPEETFTEEDLLGEAHEHWQVEFFRELQARIERERGPAPAAPSAAAAPAVVSVAPAPPSPPPPPRRAPRESPPSRIPPPPRGRLNKDTVITAMGAVKPLVADCYRQGLRVDRFLEGQVYLRFTIVEQDGEGKVQDAEYWEEETTMLDPFVQACILESLSRARFPAPEGRRLKVRYPFTLRKAAKG